MYQNLIQGGDFIGINIAGDYHVAGFDIVADSPAVPEPATWAMLLMGFGAIGFAMRRRRQTELTFRKSA